MKRQVSKRYTPKINSNPFTNSLYGSNPLSRTNTSIVDTERSDLAFNMSNNVPAIVTSISVINKYLFSDGIDITHNGTKLIKNSEFDRHLRDNYKKFGEEAMKWIYCVGVVPITFVKKNQDIVPVVVKHGSGYISTHYEDFEQTFQYHSFDVGQDSDKVVVMSGFGYSELNL